VKYPHLKGIKEILDLSRSMTKPGKVASKKKRSMLSSSTEKTLISSLQVLIFLLRMPAETLLDGDQIRQVGSVDEIEFVLHIAEEVQALSILLLRSPTPPSSSACH
jgi:hypothetical protein